MVAVTQPLNREMQEALRRACSELLAVPVGGDLPAPGLCASLRYTDNMVTPRLPVLWSYELPQLVYLCQLGPAYEMTAARRDKLREILDDLDAGRLDTHGLTDTPADE